MDFLILLQGLGVFIIDNAQYLAGFIIPFAVERLNVDVPDEQERFIVAVLVCFGFALLLHWRELAYGSPTVFAGWVAVIFFESQTLFKLYFKTSYWRTWIHDAGGSRLGDKNEIAPETLEAQPPE